MIFLKYFCFDTKSDRRPDSGFELRRSTFPFDTSMRTPAMILSPGEFVTHITKSMEFTPEVSCVNCKNNPLPFARLRTFR